MADEYPISVTFKAGEGYAAPMVTVRGNDPGEVNLALEQILDAGTLDAVVETAGVLVAAYGLTPPENKPAGKPASAGQLNYLNDLRKERGLDPVTSIGADEASEEIERLKAEPKKSSGGGGGRSWGNNGGRRSGGGGGGGKRQASQKQIDLIEKLCDEKGVSLSDYDLDEVASSAAKASEVIDELMSKPEKKSGRAWGSRG